MPRTASQIEKGPAEREEHDLHDDDLAVDVVAVPEEMPPIRRPVSQPRAEQQQGLVAGRRPQAA